jgi:hypothetical protein
MSSQKSDIPIRSSGHAAALHAAVDDLRSNNGGSHPGKIDLAGQKGFQADPYASPAIYYGESHGPRKTAKSRTLSSVSIPHICSAHSVVLIYRGEMATEKNSDADTIEFIDRRAEKPHGELGP